MIHKQTALVLIRFGFAQMDGDRITITNDGLRKAGKAPRETPAERRHRQAAESLRAQASGDWNPAQAGASAAASENDADRRRTWAEAHDQVVGAEETLDFERRFLEAIRAWGTPEQEQKAIAAVDAAKSEVAQAREELNRLSQQDAA